MTPPLPKRIRLLSLRAWQPLGLIAISCTMQAVVWGQRPSLNAPSEIFYNGKIIKVDSKFSMQEAFAVRGERFVAVGNNASVRALAGSTTRMVDLRGHAVIPGLMDNHNHNYRAALTILRGVHLSDAHSLAEMLATLQWEAGAAKAGETVLGGGGWDPESFSEKRGPTIQELDRVSAGHPMIVLLTRGDAFVNTAALNALGLNRQTPKQGRLTARRDHSGELTGEVAGSGDAFFDAMEKLVPPPSDADKERLIQQEAMEQNALGLTGIREVELAPDIMRTYFKLWRERKLTMRVSMCIAAQSSDADRMEEMLKPWGVGPGFGDHWLRLDCVGEFGLGDVFREPYADRPNSQGELGITPEKLTQAVLVMNRYGWRPSIHIQGDQTLDYVLDAYEAADREHSIRDQRWTVEHIPLVHPDQMDRLAKLNVIVSAQTRPYSKVKEIIETVGKERAAMEVPMRTLLDHHLIVSSGSDWPGRTNNPFVNMYYFVTRNTVEAGPLGISEKIGREEALRAATVANAYFTFEEDVKGSIEPGKLADFLILSADLLTVPDEEIKSILPLATYVGGQKVYSRPDGGF